MSLCKGALHRPHLVKHMAPYSGPTARTEVSSNSFTRELTSTDWKNCDTDFRNANLVAYLPTVRENNPHVLRKWMFL